MKSVFSFVVQNYELIILVAACVFDLVLFLVGVLKKKKTTPLGEVIQAIPGMIKLSEERFGSGKGKEKREAVMFMALALYRKLTGVVVTSESFIGKEIADFIEKVLETPTKKGI